MDVGALQVGEVVRVGDGLLEGVDGLGVVCIIEYRDTGAAGRADTSKWRVSGRADTSKWLVSGRADMKKWRV